MAKLRTIETNNEGNITCFFGFYPKSTAEAENNYIDFNDDNAIVLYSHGKAVATIDWRQHFYEQNVTENEIWAYILHECKKYTRARKIFINEIHVDECYFPLVHSIRPKTDEEVSAIIEAELLNDFLDTLGH